VETPQPYLGTIDEAPSWQTAGYFLETGWRINFNTWSKAFKTLFMIHNETVNVWSHLVAALFFIALLFYVPCNFDRAEYWDSDSFNMLSNKGQCPWIVDNSMKNKCLSDDYTQLNTFLSSDRL
jgi:hypothetical protein